MTCNEISELLSTYSGSNIDLCYLIVEDIYQKPIDDQIETISFFCDNFGMIKSNKSRTITPHFSDEQRDSLKEKYAKYVDVGLETSLTKAYDKGYNSLEFYKLLWGDFYKSDILESPEELAFALYYIVIDRKIPYFQLNKGMTMDDATFSKIREDCSERIQKIKFILANSFSQKTEEASLILEELIQLNSQEEQTVVLATVLATLRKEQKRAFDAIKELLSDLSD